MSLNAQGDGAARLTYDWKVGSSANSIEFDGQNTDTITFVAPEVDGHSTVSVSVDIELEGGTLLGNKSQRGSVMILDRDPPNEDIIGNGFDTQLPLVEQLNFSVVTVASTWAMQEYEVTPKEIVGKEATLQSVTRSTGVVDSADEEPSISLCGKARSESLSSLLSSENTGDFSCETTQATRYYQSESAMRVEHLCGTDIYKAIDISLQEDDATSGFGDFSAEFSGYEGVEILGDACGTTQDLKITYIDAPSPSAASSSLIVQAPYQQGWVKIVIILGEIPHGTDFYFVNSILERDKRNSITFFSDVLANLNGHQAESGQVAVYQWNEQTIEVKTTGTFTDAHGVEEEIEAYIELARP